MRRELEIPLQLSGIRIQRQHTIGVKIVPRTYVALEIRRGIAGPPVNRVELRIVGSRHPRSSAAMQIQFSWPAFRPEFAWTRYRPESPGQLAGQRIIGRNKAPHPIVAARSSYKDFVFDHERRAGGAVILVPIRICHVPDQIARAHVQTQQMRIIRFHVNPIAPHRDPAVDVPRRVIDQSLRKSARNGATPLAPYARRAQKHRWTRSQTSFHSPPAE